MRLKTRGLIVNFAYTVLVKCAESVVKVNDIDIETALSLISMVKPQIYWTIMDTKRFLNGLLNGDDYYSKSRHILWTLRFFGDCIKRINRRYTRLVDCACVEEKMKKGFGLSALDLYYVKKLLAGTSSELAEDS